VAVFGNGVTDTKVTMQFNRYVFLIILCSVFCGAVPAWAGQEKVRAPAIALARIEACGSPAIPPNAWTTLIWQIENPLDRPLIARLRCGPEEGGADVTDFDLVVPPRCRLSDRGLIASGTPESFRLTLTENGRFCDKYQVLVRRKINAEPVVVLGGKGGGLGTGFLTRTIRRPFRVRFVLTAPDRFPEHWEALASVRLVVVLDVPWVRFSQRQMEALCNYVESGGTLLFAGPAAVRGAAGTPLEDMLPVVPLSTGRVERLRCFEAWLDAPGAPPGNRLPERPDGFEMLAAKESGRGVTTLREGGFPVCRWRRVGLGTVGLVAFSPFDSELAASGWSRLLWEHILSWSTRPPDWFGVERARNAVEQAADLLTGYPTPPASQVGLAAFAYVFLVAVVVLSAFRRRRYVAGLVVAGAAGVLASGLVVWVAYRRAERLPVRMTALTGLEWTAGMRRMFDGVTILFAKHDARLTIEGRTTDTHFRGFGGRIRTEVQPDGTAVLRDLRLRALRSRRFTTTSTAGAATAARPGGTITMRPGLEGAAVTFDGPASVTPGGRGYGWLCFGGAGVERLRIPRGGGRTTLAGSGVDLSRFGTVLERFLYDAQLPGLCLAVPVRGSGAGLPFAASWPATQTAQTVWRIELGTVEFELADSRVAVPPSMIRLRAVSPTARTQVGDGRPWREALQTCRKLYAFEAYLPPPIAAGFVPEGVLIDLDVSNPGENVRVEPVLLQAPAPEDRPDATAGTEVFRPQARTRTRFEFNGDFVRRAFDPVCGSLALALDADVKRRVTAAAALNRLNRWKVRSFRLTVTGRVAGPLPRRF